MKKTYTINGKTYTQQPLVIGQLSRLLKELRGVTVEDTTPMGLLNSFGEKLPRLLACVLVPDGVSVSAVDIDTLSEELFVTPIDTVLEVLADFLELADLTSVFERIGQTVKAAVGKLPEIGTENYAPTSPEETLLEGEKSDGDAP